MRRASLFTVPSQLFVYALLTLAGCIEDGAGDAICIYNGRGYAANETFLASNGCDMCQCEETGTTRCFVGECGDGSVPAPWDASWPSADAGPFPWYDASPDYPVVDSGTWSWCNPSTSGMTSPYEQCTFCLCDGWSCREEYTLGCVPSRPLDDAGVVFPDASGGTVCVDGVCSVQCNWGGTLYDVGEIYAGYGGYNTCTCTPYGTKCSGNTWGPVCSKGGTPFADGSNVICEDGCNTCSCGAEGWYTTGRQCGAMQKVEQCPSDARGVEQARLLYRDGDKLAVEVSSPACPDALPELKLCFDGAFTGFGLTRVTLDLVPATRSSCTTLVTQQKVLDLRPLRAAYQAQFQAPSSTLQVRLENLDFAYSF